MISANKSNVFLSNFYRGFASTLWKWGSSWGGLNFDWMYPKQKQARQDFKVQIEFLKTVEKILFVSYMCIQGPLSKSKESIDEMLKVRKT